MIVLSAGELNKTYGVDTILDGVSFSVDKGDRIGIVGPNGAGKTTLLSILAGDLAPTSGNYYIRSECTVGYLRQKNNFFTQGTVLEEAEKSFAHLREMEREIGRLEQAIGDHGSKSFERNLERYTRLLDEYKDQGGYTYRSELQAVLKNMGFGEETWDKRISMLSGGENTRLALACMLLRHPDILMLDEPTNHLDLRMLAWLEQYLRAYKGTIIVVSHDRFFLDRIVDRIFDVSGTHLTAYRGNYSEYLVKKAERMEVRAREYEKQQKEIAKQEEIIRRFKQHGTEKLVNRAKSREKKLARLDRVERPEARQGNMKLSFELDYKSGNDVAIAENLEMSFGDRKIFDRVSFDIKKGERICIIGDNGVGKTTLLRILMGEVQADDGYLKIGHNVNFGYYDQGQLRLNERETVLGEMKNEYHLYTDTEMRSLLGRFLFHGDDVFKEVASLSGGEKAKLALLKLMLSGANTIVLDEPTNHLDIESREVVESALLDFDGTLIIVSHDRYLLQKIPTRILELTEHGMVEYRGQFDYYLEKSGECAGENLILPEEAEAAGHGSEEQRKARKESGQGSEERKARNGSEVSLGSSEEQRKARKEKEAEERRLRRRLEALEEEIDGLERMIDAMQKEMCDPRNSANVPWMMDKSRELDRLQRELDEKTEEWVGLQ